MAGKRPADITTAEIEAAEGVGEMGQLMPSAGMQAAAPVKLTELNTHQPITEYNQGTTNIHIIMEVYDSFANHKIIMDSLEDGRGLDLKEAMGREKGKTVICTGSGPSFDEGIPLMKKWKGDIICSSSQFSTLIYHGIRPTYVVILDPATPPEEFDIPDAAWDFYNPTFVLHPGIRHAAVKKLAEKNAKCIYFRKGEPQTPFYANAQNVGYSTREFTEPEPGGNPHAWKLDAKINIMIIMFSNVLPAQMFIAECLGYTNQYFVGADYGMSYDRERFTLASFKNGAWVVSPTQPMRTEIDKKRDQKSQELIETPSGIPSRRLHLFYKRNFISAWRMSTKNLFICKENGINGSTIIEMPTVDLETVIHRQGKPGGAIKEWPQSRCNKVAEQYLALHDQYVVKMNKGLKFVEVPHEKPMRDILGFVSQALIRENDIDVCENMNRFSVLIEYARRYKEKAKEEGRDLKKEGLGEDTKAQKAPAGVEKAAKLPDTEYAEDVDHVTHVESMSKIKKAGVGSVGESADDAPA